MFLSSIILQDALADYAPEVVGRKSLKKRKYMYVQMPQTEAELLPEHALVVTKDYLSHFPNLKNRLLICIGQPPETVKNNNLCLCISEDVDPRQVLQKIQETFSLLNIWERNLQQILKQSQSLKEICLKSIPVFQKPIFVHDQNNELLVSVNEHERQFKWQYDAQTGKHCLPMEILNDFKVSEEYHHTMKTFGADMFSADEFGYRILYINLRINLIYVGRICICELGNEIRQGDYELLEYLADIIISALQQGNLIVANPMQGLENLFHEMLNGTVYNREEIALTLNHYGWNIDDPYFCASIFFQKSDFTINTMTYLTNRLLNIFSSCCVFQEEHEVVIVANGNRFSGTLSDFLVTLSFFIGDDLLSAGISKIGHDFSDFLYYFRQTELARELGKNEENSSHVFFFEESIYRYLLHSMMKDMRPEMLLDRHLEELMAYDKNHGTEFTKTLHRYLQNERNVKLTALDLDIHRSTMNYRIERIQELLKLDLGDPQIRLQLLISFALLKASKSF